MKQKTTDDGHTRSEAKGDCIIPMRGGELPLDSQQITPQQPAEDNQRL